MGPGMQADLRIPFSYPLVIQGVSNLADGQELGAMFVHHLVSGHSRVQTGSAGIGKEGTVTTVGVVGLNVVTGCEKRKPEWMDVAWLAMRVHVGRQRKGRVDVMDVEGEEEAPPAPPLPGSGKPSPCAVTPELESVLALLGPAWTTGRVKDFF